MRIRSIFLSLSVLSLAVLAACGSNSIMTDVKLKERVEQRLASRADWLPVMPDGMSGNESEAMNFLYAYLPVGDVADYSTDFFLANVRQSLVMRDEMPWGKSVAEREFLHYVLPVRVNNEALDTSRVAFYAELKDRVKGLSMKEAILEVNHWCHEKVNYSPTDARTMSPLALMANSTGRCGEESTFAVAALRSVGIPARQIYVPRWAHTDDNHAWVEAWAADSITSDGTSNSGKWYYIGACEPEPVLNTGWFDAPAKRSLLMLTKVFGEYAGDEQVLSAADGYTEISVTENYAPVRTTTVVVEDETGAPVEGAEVLYTIYNYATFYPAVRRVSDANGTTTLTAGLGDMVVFASKDGLLANEVLDFRTADTLRLRLGALPAKSIDIDVVPPRELPVDVVVSQEARETNNVRFAAEDSLRTAYNATFITRQKSNEIALELGADTTRVWNLLSTTRGNHAQIVTFLLNAPRENLSLALDLLEVISLKDMRDTPCPVLLDHLNASVRFKDRPHFKEYILNPRIDNELLTPYRSVLFLDDTTMTAEPIIASLAAIKVVDSLNPAKLAISPLGVKTLAMGDKTSIERLVIASLRSNGIAARREPLSRRLQYFDNGQWQYITSMGDKTTQTAVPAKGKLMIKADGGLLVKDTKLDTHFTLSKWRGARYVPVQFESLGVDMGGEATLSGLFAKPIEIEAGQYLLTTGTRLSNGKVLARNEPITVAKDSLSKVNFTMRQASDELNVIGAINAETRYFPQGSDALQTLLSTTGRGYFVVAMIDSKKEPTTHFMRALGRQKAVLEKWGRPIVLVLRDKKELDALNLKDFPELPSTVSFGYDNNGAMSRMIGEMCEVRDMNRLPVVVVGDSFGRVVYVSTGYNTSIGEELSTIIDLL